MLPLAPMMNDTVGKGVAVLFLATHVALARTTCTTCLTCCTAPVEPKALPNFLAALAAEACGASMLLLAPIMSDTVGEGVGVLFLATHVALPRTTGPARLQAKIEIPCASFLPTDTATHAFLTSFMQTLLIVSLVSDFCSKGKLCLVRFAGNTLQFF